MAGEEIERPAALKGVERRPAVLTGAGGFAAPQEGEEGVAVVQKAVEVAAESCRWCFLFPLQMTKVNVYEDQNKGKPPA